MFKVGISQMGPGGYYYSEYPFVFGTVEEAVAFYYNIGWKYDEEGDCFYAANDDDLVGWVSEFDNDDNLMHDCNTRPTVLEVNAKTIRIERHFE